MKKTLVMFILMLSTSIFSQECNYKIELQDQINSFILNIETVNDMPSMGDLVITELKISKPQDTNPGTILMNVSLDPDAMYLPALGPQKGSFEFFKGVKLPQIINGQYEIVINENSCGYLIFSNKKVEYFPLEKSYQ